MKAIICEKYGPLDTLQLRDVEKPSPKEDEVLVKIYASSINYNNLAHVCGQPFAARFFLGLKKPKFATPGNDIAGQIETVGKSVKRFHPGDEVFGDLSSSGFGAFAEYITVPEMVLSPKPANITFAEAATVPEAAVVALQGLRKGQIEKGQKVLVYGASGGIGTFAVQLAKAFGAEVTGVCSSRNLDMVRSIGADHVIDYTCQDFTQNGQKYDLILATAGYCSIFDYQRALSSTGHYVVTGGAMAQIFQGILLGPWLSVLGDKKLGNLMANTDQKDLAFVKGLIDMGKVKPVIDRSYALSEVGKALHYYQQGHSRGKVVITITITA